MGASCSKLDKDSDPDQRHEKEFDGPAARLQKKIVSHHRGGKMNDPGPREQLVIGHYDEKVTTKLDGLDPQKPLIYEEQTSKPDLAPDSPTETQQPESQYFQDRVEIERRGRQLAFDHALTVKATTSEQKAKVLLEIIRQNDEVVFYSLADPLQGYRGQKHRRFAGDHFLTNSEILVQTALFRVAQEMPKGAHLHLHFNSTLLPNELLDIAENMEQMYISSDKALTSAENCDTCEIQFLMKSEVVTADDRTTLQAKLSKEGLASSDAELCNLFHRDYTQRVNDSNQRLSWMKYRVFREQWARISETRTADKGRATRKNSAVKKSLAVDDLQSLVDFENTSKDWLISKLVFDDQEAHNSHQTSEGAWDKFNGRTRMMKGLFNYETAFVTYTRKCLEEFERDKIQYAEIRPNFMMTNQIYTDDGSKQLDNEETMRKIVEVYKLYKKQHISSNIYGLKVIYCTPRSFPADKVQAALEECLSFKKGEFKDYIAGFDLVGEEAQGKPLKAFIPQFLDFKRKCVASGVEIPFLFHCGETLELGGDTDGNLIDALLLDSKRIGHGFALARKPYLMAEFKKRDICLELCPISNQVLGLTPRMNGHAMYDLLANNVHCTVNSDNGTLFKSTLSHDFYEVMVGSKSMNLHGWRQLIEWSIKHASLDSSESKQLETVWEPLWNNFVSWILQRFGSIQQINKRSVKPSGARKKGESDKDWQERVRLETQDYEKDEAQFQYQVKEWRDLASLP